MQAKNIDQVIEGLDNIIDVSKKENSPKGYFSALYRKVTKRVKEGIETGEFDNGPRMEELDVTYKARFIGGVFPMVKKIDLLKI